MSSIRQYLKNPSAWSKGRRGKGSRLTYVWDGKDEIDVYAEMPGVNENDIKMDLLGNTINISVESGVIKYRKSFSFPQGEKRDARPLLSRMAYWRSR